jgi:hypothetical protein
VQALHRARGLLKLVLHQAVLKEVVSSLVYEGDSRGMDLCDTVQSGEEFEV